MPTFERSSFNNGFSTPASAGGGAYDKVFAIFNKSHQDQSPMGKGHKVQIALKNVEAYQKIISVLPSGLYKQAAGTDLSNLFYPFETTIGSGEMPSFYSGVNPVASPKESGNFPSLANLLPFRWDSTQSGFIFDRYNPSASGDSYTYAMSSDQYFGDVDRFRDISKIKSIGMRLPMMGVGWGTDLAGNPFPSGAPASGTPNYPSGIAYKNGQSQGWTLDPWEYIAAPIDFKYDTRRNVWTCSSDPGFYAIVTNYNFITPPISGMPSGIAYDWVQAYPYVSGFLFKPGDKIDDSNDKAPTGGYISGYLSYGAGSLTSQNPAYEVNNMLVPLNTKVWLYQTPTRSDYYLFKFDCPPGSGIYKVLQIIDNTGNAAYDYPRFGP